MINSRAVKNGVSNCCWLVLPRYDASGLVPRAEGWSRTSPSSGGRYAVKQEVIAGTTKPRSTPAAGAHVAAARRARRWFGFALRGPTGSATIGGMVMPRILPDLVELPQQSLEGTVALVTGGTRGIGLACTVGLATLGATVVMVGRSKPHVEKAARDLVARGLDVVGATVDVSDAQGVRTLPAQLGALAEPDLLVCAAGVMTLPTAKTLRTEQHEWDRVLAVNLTGVFTTMATFVPAMTARRSGRVVVLSACLGRMSGPGTAGGLAPYRISKAGVNALVRNLAHETGNGSRGVTVDAVCPGHCRTDMGGPDAPRSAEQGADSVLWLCTRPDTTPTGVLWEDRSIVPW